MSDVEVQIILPPRSEDELSSGLRWLTAELCKRLPDAETGFGLGGEHGYGVDYENDTFAMRRFYWGDCDCGWCEAEADWHERNDAARLYKEDRPAHDAKWTEFLALHPGHKPTCSLELPNFHYKPTGFKVRWYKWIGRDNETEGDPGDVRTMLGQCLASVAPTAGEQG